MKLADLFEHRWWDLRDTVTLYHGTSSAFLPAIQADGLTPPAEDFRAYALDLLEQALAGVEAQHGPIPAETREEIHDWVVNRTVGYRTRSRGFDGERYDSVLYFLTVFERAARYARSYAEHGGEVAYEVWSLIKTFTGFEPPKRLAGHRPVVIEVEVPSAWMRLSGQKDIAQMAQAYRKSWDPDTDGPFEDHMEEMSHFEIRIDRPVPPSMIRAIHPAD